MKVNEYTKFILCGYFILALSGCLNVPFVPMVDVIDVEYSSDSIANHQQES